MSYRPPFRARVLPDDLEALNTPQEGQVPTYDSVCRKFRWDSRLKIVKPTDLEVVNVPQEGHVLTYDHATQKFKWDLRLKTVGPADLEVINDPQEDYVLAYDSATQKFKWDSRLKTVKPNDLEAINSPTANYVPAYDSATQKFKWVEMVGGGQAVSLNMLRADVRVENLQNTTEQDVITVTGPFIPIKMWFLATIFFGGSLTFRMIGDMSNNTTKTIIGYTTISGSDTREYNFSIEDIRPQEIGGPQWSMFNVFEDGLHYLRIRVRAYITGEVAYSVLHLRLIGFKW